MDVDAEVMTLWMLPIELHAELLEACEHTTTLCTVGQVCHRWRELQAAAAMAVLTRRSGIDESANPCALRSLKALEELEVAVGPAPSRTTWRNEWCALDMEQDHLNGDPHAELWLYEPGQPCAIETRLQLQHHADAVQWCVAASWDPADAESYTLIFNYGRGAVQEALSQKSPRYAASTHAIVRALHRAALMRPPSFVAPDAYVNLVGAWGLAVVDPSWHALPMRPSAAQIAIKTGLSFRTRGVAGAERADAKAFPNDSGIHVPLTYEHATVWECQEGPVVRFVSRPADALAMRSLIRTSETAFDLPPLALVTLEEVAEAGEWQVLELRPRCRLYTVSVAFG